MPYVPGHAGIEIAEKHRRHLLAWRGGAAVERMTDYVEARRVLAAGGEVVVRIADIWDTWEPNEVALIHAIWNHPHCSWLYQPLHWPDETPFCDPFSEAGG